MCSVPRVRAIMTALIHCDISHLCWNIKYSWILSGCGWFHKLSLFNDRATRPNPVAVISVIQPLDIRFINTKNRLFSCSELLWSTAKDDFFFFIAITRARIFENRGRRNVAMSGSYVGRITQNTLIRPFATDDTAIQFRALCIKPAIRGAPEDGTPLRNTLLCTSSRQSGRYYTVSSCHYYITLPKDER